MNRILIALSITLISACGNGEPAVPAGGIQIVDIQGAGDTSPMNGQQVSFSAIVSGDFQNNDADTSSNLGGFYVQQEFPDSDAATSEGVFVFDGEQPETDVDVGDRVDIEGVVKEYFGETQVSALSVTVSGSGSIAATDVSLPVAAVTTNSDGDIIADLERFEGMLLRFPQRLGVSNLRALEQFGEVGLSQGDRLHQFTNDNLPDAAGYGAHKTSIAARSIVLDDGMRSKYPSTIRLLNAGPTADYSIRTGDSIGGATGNLRYSRGSGGGGDETWRLMPTTAPVFEADNPRPGAPGVGGSVRIASLNVLNFFSNIDRGRASCGPQGDDNCRGADSHEELARQLAKTVSTLALMDADVIGLIELENNANESIAAIVDALNVRLDSRHYAFVDTGTIHSDAIKTGFVYDSSSIRLAGSFALLDSSIDPRFNDSRNRPALAQTFEVVNSGAVITVVVNHLKSKGSSCEANGDPNTGDGQGNCNRTRSAAATALVDWVDADPTGSGDPDVLIIGDLNAYLMEEPLRVFRNAGMTNLIEATDRPYSYVYDGQAGALDHAVASKSLVAQVVETFEWHINADEPALLDYNLENGRDAARFDPDTPYRSSDHDPIIVGLDLTD